MKKILFPIILTASLLMTGCGNDETIQLYFDKNDYKMDDIVVAAFHSFSMLSYIDTEVNIAGVVHLGSNQESPITDEVSNIKLLNEDKKETIDITISGPNDYETDVFISAYKRSREYTFKATVSSSYYNENHNYCFSFTVREKNFVYHLYKEKGDSDSSMEVLKFSYVL